MDLPNKNMNLKLDLDLEVQNKTESQDTWIVYKLKLAKKFKYIIFILLYFKRWMF